MIWTVDFWKDTAERVIYTMAECFLGCLAGNQVIDLLNWKVTATVVLTSGLVTLLKCVVVSLDKDDGKIIGE